MRSVPDRANRRWLLAKRPRGDITEANFEWNETTVPSLEDGQYLARNLWFAYGPTQRLLMGSADPADANDGSTRIGETMPAFAISEIVESRHPVFKAGDVVHGGAGWEDFSVADGTGFAPTYRVPEGVPPDWAIGVFGLTGLAAYFGVTEIAKPKPGEIFVISGAAGGVGSLAVQLAKIRGARVIGIAGSAAKCNWLVREAGVEGAINYHTEDVASRLTELCPDGLDVFFDNDGGPTLDLAIQRLRQGGRIVLCGATSLYPATALPPGPSHYLQLVMVNGRMEGLLARDYIPRLPDAVAAMLPLLRSGRLKPADDVLVGLRNAPRGLIRLYAGENIGRQLLRMDDPTTG